MITPQKYNELKPAERRELRNLYIKVQGGNCYYCHKPIEGEPCKSVSSKPVNRNLFPTGFFMWPVHLHHDHKTDLTIGAVHSYCNAVLWEYEGE